MSDPEVIDSIRVLAETEGIFAETAGGVTVGTAGKLYRQDRILPEETTVLCITGNGLKTTDVLAGVYEMERPIARPSWPSSRSICRRRWIRSRSQQMQRPQ